MKKYLIIFASTVIFFSCKKKLDLFPETELSAETNFSTYDGAFLGVSALYARLSNGDSKGILGSERNMLPSTGQENTPGSDDLAWNAADAGFASLWKKYYAFIAQANILVKSLEANTENSDSSFSQSGIEQGAFKTAVGSIPSFSASKMLLGEVRFLRAYAYFTLYRYFGGVPLLLEPQGSQPTYIPRSSREEMFSFLYSEYDYAMQNCVLNTSGILLGRVTKGAVAGMLAKTYVFHASYIKRAQDYGAAFGESTEAGNTAELYSKAMTLCDGILSGTYGDYELVKYYPAIFTKNNKEVMFGGYAIQGNGTGNLRVTNAGQVQPMQALYDGDVWNHNSRLKDFYKAWGEVDFEHLDPPNPVPPNSLILWMVQNNIYSLSGDTMRRMWNIGKTQRDGPKDDGVSPAGLWIFEAIGHTIGPEGYIPPGKGVNGYTAGEMAVLSRLSNPIHIPWWRDLQLTDRTVWSVSFNYNLEKFRSINPQDQSSSFDYANTGVGIPILRLAEIYLLKAEIQHFTGDNNAAIATMNIIRDRASNQSTIRDLWLKQGDAPFTYKPGAVHPLPTTLTDGQVRKELVYERLRELLCEDDCGWLDGSRFPDVLAEDISDETHYGDPWQGGILYYDGLGKRGDHGFNTTDKVYKVLLPIPASEFNFFPEMKQNPGY